MTERTYRHLRTRLATGQLQSGTQLSETEISKEIGVGRTPVREAFLLLENEGFIEQVPRYGTFVKSAGRHERQSLYELREVLESYAAGKAAEYMSDASIEKLGTLCEQMRASIRQIRDDDGHASDAVLSAIAIADMAFHMLVLRASGNHLVIRSVADMHLMSRVWGGDRGDPKKISLRIWADSWREHVRIYRAIRRRDGAAAARWMSVHLHNATVAALKNYDQQCRVEGAEAVGYEWPEEVRRAITQFDEFGLDAK